MSAAYEFIELEYVDTRSYLDKIVPNYWWVTIKTEGPDPHTMKLGGIYEKPTSESDKSVRLKAVVEEWQEQLRDIEESDSRPACGHQVFPSQNQSSLTTRRFWAGHDAQIFVFFSVLPGRATLRAARRSGRDIALISATSARARPNPPTTNM